MNIFSKYNKGNVLIIGGVNTGKTSILYKLLEESIERGENIHLIDCECELYHIYKNSSKLKSNIFVSKSLNKIEKFKKNLNDGDTIVVDDITHLTKELIDILLELKNTEKYRFIITTNDLNIPSSKKFNNTIVLRTSTNFSKHIWYETSHLELGTAKVNKLITVQFPIDKWIKEKAEKVTENIY